MFPGVLFPPDFRVLPKQRSTEIVFGRKKIGPNIVRASFTVESFFRSTFCTEDQLKKLIGNETNEDAAKNFPPTIAARNAKIRTKFEVENVKDKQFKYYEITYDDINKVAKAAVMTRAWP